MGDSDSEQEAERRQVRLKRWADCSRVHRDMDLRAQLKYRARALRHITGWSKARAPNPQGVVLVRLNPLFFPKANPEFYKLKVSINKK